MDQPADIKGRIPETRVPEVFSSIIKSGFEECSLLFLYNGFTKILKIKDNRIIFIDSEDPQDTFYNFLVSNSDLSESDLKKALSFSEKSRARLGKSLCELDMISYRELWKYVTDHQNQILENICDIETGEYSLYEHSDDVSENIKLDLPLSKVILHIIRNSDFTELVNEKLEIINKVFIKERQPELPDDIFRYEEHVLHLCIKYRDIDNILKNSELKESDTLKYIYYYYLIDVISTEKIGLVKGQQVKDYISVNISFSSYEEALKHYNIKFEMIYKILSKEIGPVALSILSKSIDDIRDNLPVFLKGAELDKNGKLMDKKILKKVWYHDYENHSSEFVRGLEELLYSQIFAVKKNLGVEYENQILKWLKGTGN